MLLLKLYILTSFTVYSMENDDEDDFDWGLDDDDAPKVIDWDKVPVHDLIILGSGPAGSTAALYAARAGLKPLVIRGNVPGGQLTYTSEVENFPSFEGTGTELVTKMEEQAKKYGANYIQDHIVTVNLSTYPRRLESQVGEGYLCKSLIIATGAKAKYLGLESEKRFINRGVSACAVCDGSLFTGRDVAVVGGGDIAAEEALYLSKICKSVTLYHRRDKLRASLPMREKLFSSSVNIVYDTVVDEVLGDDMVNGLKTRNVKTGEIKTVNVSALFVAIGQSPQTEIFKGQLPMDEYGYFKTDGSPRTNVKGVFVAGDCADKVYRQAITSAGSGCQAALLVEKFLTEVE